MHTKPFCQTLPFYLFLLIVNGLPIFAATFQGLGDLPGGNVASYATAVSADGTVVAGYSESANGMQAFLWTATNGLEGLGDLPGGSFSSFANSISSNGAVVVGSSTSSNGIEAFRWTRSTGMVGLGDLPGGSFSSRAFAVSSDGQTIVGSGMSALSGTRDEAFRWTASGGMTSLGEFPGGKYSSRAWAISPDASVIVGESEGPNGNEAFRWTASTGMVGLGDFPGGYTNSIAYAVSPDGSVVVGRGYSGAYDLGTHEAFSWTSASGLVRLGFIPCSDWSIAHAVSSYGLVIVGDPESGQDCAFIWDSQHGMRNLHEVLVDEHGLNLSDWQLKAARGISYDGTTIVGYGTNPSGQKEGWIVSGLKPAMAIRTSANTGILSWPSSASNFVLQSSDNLLNGWSNCAVSLVTNGISIIVTQGFSGDKRFYRLKK